MAYPSIDLVIEGKSPLLVVPAPPIPHDDSCAVVHGLIADIEDLPGSDRFDAVAAVVHGHQSPRLIGAPEPVRQLNDRPVHPCPLVRVDDPATGSHCMFSFIDRVECRARVDLLLCKS